MGEVAFVPQHNAVWVKTMEALQEFAKFVTTLCCGLFAGAALYINLIEHPARLECGTELAHRNHCDCMMSVSEGNIVFRNHRGSCRKGRGCHNEDTHDIHNRHDTLHNLST
jgi:hypothetical protein